MQKTNTLFRVSGLLLALTPLAFAQKAQPVPGNLLINGDFETTTGEAGWERLNNDGVSIQEEDGNRFLSISNPDATKNTDVRQVLLLEAPAEGKKWVLTGRVRVKRTAPGEANWHTVRVQTTWWDDKDKAVKSWPMTPAFLKPTNDWVEFKATLTVPPSATKLVIQPAIYQSVGAADFDDLVVLSADAAK